MPFTRISGPPERYPDVGIMSTPGMQTMFCAHGCAETHWKSMGGMGSYLRVFGQIRRIRISTAQLLEIQERTRGISNVLHS